ncbi:retropepsin-like aspartic protease family protein [Aliiroseovarius crassostreae]|uniref:retropepsin-like aspartic protease family protein n=1 Tax=Aliiroseovarius crassostreae TaxID=154981 RepID=UPI0021AFFE7E|nr:TIGR02281 family clan AA aspartic protease [Aliiroseovarius crassostreae]UWP99608.1 TIGR02281 family clan AA aspartic protease [Aliiroseovarius crassostreae]
MTADDIGRLAYLALLLTAVAGYFISENRFNLGQTLRHALIWVFIFIGAMAGVGLWNDIRNDISPQQSFIETSGQVVLPRAFDGHFYIQLKMNGQPIDFIVDTGASNVVLTKEDAERAGVDPSSLRYFGRALTANGTTRTAPANIARVELEGITDYGVEVWVNEGEMPQSLLGNSYLQRFDKIEIRRDQLVLTR